ncbi:MAG: hypothetical protein ACLUEK_09700 [Oscillospiraceae bacterium]
MADYNELIRSLKAAAYGFADIARDLAGARGQARDLAGGAYEKAKALAKLAKLSMELNSERDSLNEAYAEVASSTSRPRTRPPRARCVRAFDRVMLSGGDRAHGGRAHGAARLPERSKRERRRLEDIVDAEAEAADGSIEVEITEDKPRIAPAPQPGKIRPFPGQARETGRLCNFKSGRPQAARGKTRPCISCPNDVKCQKGGLSHV